MCSVFCGLIKTKSVFKWLCLQAFTMIDQDRDGVISVDDLREIYNSLGTSRKVIPSAIALFSINTSITQYGFSGVDISCTTLIS